MTNNPKRPRGRQPGSVIVPPEERMIRANVTFRPDDYAKFKARGGSKYIRELINKDP